MYFSAVKIMGVATTTDTTNSVRTSFGILKKVYGISVQVNETTKKKKRKVYTARNYWLKDELVFGSEVRFWTWLGLG